MASEKEKLMIMWERITSAVRFEQQQLHCEQYTSNSTEKAGCIDKLRINII